MPVICSIGGKNFVSHNPVWKIYIYIPVAFPERVILIIMKSLKHCTGGHIVTIYYCIKIFKIQIVSCINKYRTVRTVFTICIMVEIIRIIASLQNRIVNVCPRYIYPCTYITILCFQAIKINIQLRIVSICCLP